MSAFCRCPRCGEKALEVLKSYSHCINCFYVHDRWENPESDYFEALKAIKGLQIKESDHAQVEDQFKNQFNERNEDENKSCA